VPISVRRKPRISGTAADLACVLGATLVVVAAAVVGRVLLAAGVDIFLPFPPLLAEWLPHVGPGTPVAVAVSVLVGTQGPALADRLPWGRLLAAGYAAAVMWTVALALVDGWQRGVVERLTSSQEYLNDVSRVPDVGAMLHTFADHILTDQPSFWTTHVGAHPPGALLTFVWLDRVGLGGGGPAGLFVMLVGASAPIAPRWPPGRCSAGACTCPTGWCSAGCPRWRYSRSPATSGPACSPPQARSRWSGSSPRAGSGGPPGSSASR
jgi:hypothetical protein